MQTNKFNTSFIILRSLFNTFIHLCESLILAIRRKLTRRKTDAILYKWSKKLLAIAKIKLIIFGQFPKIKPHRSYIIMCNHNSLYDIPISFVALPNLSIRMLAKKELSKIPFFGKTLSINEFIYVDRKDKTEALKDLELAKKKLQDGIILWVAPEGTRSKTGKLMRFKKGVFHLAMQTQAIIVPLAIKNAEKVLPAKTLNLNLQQEVKINICKPIDCKNYQNDMRDDLMNTVKKAMEDFLEKQ